MEDAIIPTLKSRRRSLRLSQQQVAQRGGMEQANYSKVELGKIDPRLSTLQEIARALSLEVMLVPVELTDTVNSLIGQGPTPEEKPLFSATGD